MKISFATVSESSQKSAPEFLDFEMGRANRHGLIAGATGTGKTVTLQSIVQEFSLAGVPVFVTDVKGDLSGLALPSAIGGWQEKAFADLGRKFEPVHLPVQIWDLLGQSGVPLRTTITELGPILLSRLLDLNETQEGVLNVCFRAADDSGMALLDLKDLREFLKHMSENEKELSDKYGRVSGASISAIQRSLLALESEGGAAFFGEPAIKISDLMQKNADGLGSVSILSAEKLINSGRLYSAFLLWLISELFEQMPECGDQSLPKFALFFDEAHLLFKDAPKALLEKIEQVVRLIRSKGVGVYFITQSPLDIPESVLAQLGHRVQHAMRAFTAKDQKDLRATARTFRNDNELELESELPKLEIGHAMVSFLDEKGIPSNVRLAKVLPPRTRVGPLTAVERQSLIAASNLYSAYATTIDRESAYEKLQLTIQKASSANSKDEIGQSKQSSQTQDVVSSFAKSAARAIGSELGRQIIRGVLGGILGSSKRRRT